MSGVETKIRRDVFRHVESELYAYPYRKREIEQLRQALLNPQQLDEGEGRSSLPGDPTANKAIALASHAKLVHMERMNAVIEETYNRLPEVKQEFMRVMYWTSPQHLTRVGICDKLGISDRTFSRWRLGIVNDIAEKLGWK